MRRIKVEEMEIDCNGIYCGHCQQLRGKLISGCDPDAPITFSLEFCKVFKVYLQEITLDNKGTIASKTRLRCRECQEAEVKG